VSTTEELHAPTLGEPGDTCVECGAPLAPDQRYCLNCGLRRAEARIPFRDILAEEYAPAEQPKKEEKPKRAQSLRNSPWIAAASLASVVIVMALGVLIGAVVSKDDSKPVQAAATPPVVNVNGGGGAGTGTAGKGAGDFTSDWPEGKDGWTVQLSTVENTVPVTEVETAKQDATTKGATEVGALNSDDYSSLDPGQYVVYSGVFDDEKQAKSALKKLKKDFADAKVVEVSSTGAGKGTEDVKKDKSATQVGSKELQDLTKGSAEQRQKKSLKLPNKLQTQGKAPKKDNKAPGAGSGGETIK
jgi:hypothetical protein